MKSLLYAVALFLFVSANAVAADPIDPRSYFAIKTVQSTNAAHNNLYARFHAKMTDYGAITGNGDVVFATSIDLSCGIFSIEEANQAQLLIIPNDSIWQFTISGDTNFTGMPFSSPLHTYNSIN